MEFDHLPLCMGISTSAATAVAAGSRPCAYPAALVIVVITVVLLSRFPSACYTSEQIGTFAACTFVAVIAA
jgi:hypothetical protein